MFDILAPNPAVSEGTVFPKLTRNVIISLTFIYHERQMCKSGVLAWNSNNEGIWIILT